MEETVAGCHRPIWPLRRASCPQEQLTPGQFRTLPLHRLYAVLCSCGHCCRRELHTHCSKDRGLTQHRVLTRESNSAIAPEGEGGHDGSRVCAGDLESVTVGGSGLEVMAVGRGSG